MDDIVITRLNQKADKGSDINYNKKSEIPLEVTNQFSGFLLATYYVLESITTAGYGDIIPNGSINMLISILIQIMGVLFYGYVTKQINSFINLLNSWVNKKRNSKDRIEAWLMVRFSSVFRKDKNGIVNRVKNSLNYMLFNDYRQHLDTVNFRNLPIPIQNDFINDLCLNIAQTFHSFFKLIEFDDTEKIIRCLQLKIFIADQLIQKQGVYSEGLYFIKKGLAEICHGDRLDSVIIRIREGAFFGENCLIREVNPCSIK